MKRFMTGALVWGFVGVVSYFSLAKKDSPKVVHANAAGAGIGVAVAVAKPAPSEPAPPATLPTVVEMTDLTPLLDPPVRPVGGVPFDTETVVPATLIPAPALIPLSDD